MPRGRVLFLLFVVVALAVFAARTMGRPTRVEPTPRPQTTAAPSATVPPVPRQTNTAVAAARVVAPTRTPVPVALRPTREPTSHPNPQSIATVAKVATVVASPTSTSTPHSTVGSVALTFDAGADRGYAEDILDLLAEQHVVASFGITGLWARANPDLVRRMAADGHLVFNHTLDHRSFTGFSDGRGGLSAAARRAELDDADVIIAPLIGRSTRPFYRLPYGDDDAHVASDVQADGYTRKIGWTVDSLGWRGVSSTDIVARCLTLAASGGVYVFHVGRASQDAIALPQIIHGLRDKGFSFHRVDQA